MQVLAKRALLPATHTLRYSSMHAVPWHLWDLLHVNAGCLVVNCLLAWNAGPTCCCCDVCSQGMDCFGAFMQSGLPKAALKQIWDLVAGDEARLK